jgi:hypothetical protein
MSAGTRLKPSQSRLRLRRRRRLRREFPGPAPGWSGSARLEYLEGRGGAGRLVMLHRADEFHQPRVPAGAICGREPRGGVSQTSVTLFALRGCLKAYRDANPRAARGVSARPQRSFSCLWSGCPTLKVGKER